MRIKRIRLGYRQYYVVTDNRGFALHDPNGWPLEFATRSAARNRIKQIRSMA